MIPLINYDSSEGEQWGRYNLPRLMVTMIVDIPMIDAYTDKSSPIMFAMTAMISQLNQWSMGI